MNLINAIRSLVVAALLAAAPAHAQVDVRVSITGSTGTHSTSISNVAPAGTPDVASVQLTWAGSGTWDSYDGAGFTETPDVGANNDGTSSPVITLGFSPALGSGGNSLGSGDTDGTLSGITAVVTWVGGTSASAPLTLSGGTWSALIQRPVAARPAHLTWTPPTLNTDGTPLTNLAGYRLYWGTAPGPMYPNSVNVSDPAATSYDVTGLTAGTRYYFAATARNVIGAESTFSNEAELVALALPSSPVFPTDLRTSVADVPVYAPFLTRNAQSMIQVGTAPADLPCDRSQHVAGYGSNETLFLVPVESVRLFPGVFPEAVFAPCAPP